MKKTLKNWIVYLVIMVVLVGGSVIYVLFFTPKDSLELYQEIAFADDFKDMEKLMLEGYEGNFQEEDFNYIKDNSHSTNSIGQFTILEYHDKTYMIMTSPGTERLKVLDVEELPEDIRSFFLEKRKNLINN